MLNDIEWKEGLSWGILYAWQSIYSVLFLSPARLRLAESSIYYFHHQVTFRLSFVLICEASQRRRDALRWLCDFFISASSSPAHFR